MARQWLYSMTLSGGAVQSVSFHIIDPADLPIMVASGAAAAVGAVPSPGLTAGTGRYLREDATWAVPAGGGGTGTVTSVNITAPTAGLTATGGPITTSGAITLALADDLAALEALSGTNTIYYRSAVSIWSAVVIGSGLSFTAGVLSSTSPDSGIWNYSTNVTMADPGSGKIRVNSASAATATLMALSSTTGPGTDVSAYLRTLRTGDTIYAQERATAANWVRYRLTANPTDNTTWFQIPITLLDGTSVSGSINNNADLILSFTRSGTGSASISDGNKGDVTVSSGGTVWTINAGAVTPAKMDTGPALTVLGQPGATAGVRQNIAATANGQYLQMAAGGLNFNPIGTADLPLNALTAADPALADTVAGYSAGAAANRKFPTDRLLALSRLAPGGRLTLTAGTPVTTGDVVGAGVIRYTPYVHDLVCLWDGTRWKWTTFTETTLTLSGLMVGQNYDVFLYAAPTPTLELVLWANPTLRQTDLTFADGRYCLSTNKTRLYVGTFRATAATTTEDSAARRFVWNAYNRVPRTLRRIESAGSWTGSADSWGAWNNSAANRVELVVGLNLEPVDVLLLGGAISSVGSTALLGLGIDVTNAPASSNLIPVIGGGGIAYYQNGSSTLRDYVGLGYHFVQALQWGGTGVTFVGTGTMASGISGTTFA